LLLEASNFLIHILDSPEVDSALGSLQFGEARLELFVELLDLLKDCVP
jgi:hypothetical protein